MANAAYLGLPAEGRVVIYNASAAPVDVVIDVSGHFTDATAAPASGALLWTVRNYRVLDTRSSAPVSAGARTRSAWSRQRARPISSSTSSATSAISSA